MLVLKLLGRNISYKILLQRVEELGKSEYGFEMIDMEKGFSLVFF